MSFRRRPESRHHSCLYGEHEVNTRKIFKIALAALLAVALVVVGIAVWPPPKEALAVNTTFNADVRWIGVQPDPDAITLWVYTYTADWIVVETWALSHTSTVGQVSQFKRVEPLPLDPAGVRWGVIVVDDGGYEFAAISINDGDWTNFGGANFLDEEFEAS